MAAISKEQARKILEENGYKVLGYLGEGAASHVFKASRESKKNPKKEKVVAAKVCCPGSGSWANLKMEINAAKELEELRKKFKLKLLKEGKLQGAEKYFLKYLTIPKLKGKPEVDRQVAIFEASLADSDVLSSDIEATSRKTCVDERGNTVLENVNIDYHNIKRVIKSILKGLMAIHEQGMSHGDIRWRNILSKFDAGKGKYRYSVTDFGTLKTSCIAQDIKKDLQNAADVIISLWFSVYLFGIIDDIDNMRETVFSGAKKSYIDGEIPDDPPSRGVSYVRYKVNAEDKSFCTFCKKLYGGDFKSASEALADPWLKKQ